MKIKERIRNLMFHPGDTLSQRAARSGFWLIFFRIIERILRFIKTAILAHLLSPSDFGLFGIACIGIEMLDTFTQMGFDSALVQKKEDIRDDLNTAWTLGIIRAFILSVVLFFSAPYFALFFKNNQAAPLTRVIALSYFLSSFVNIGTIYFVKEIEFKKTRLISLYRIASEFIVAMAFAFILKNAWALVWAKLVGTITACFVSYALHPYRPKLHLEFQRARKLFKFGKWISASAILTFLLTQGDDILVGRVLGATALGFYAMAYAISNLGVTEITQLFSQIMFPAFSKVQDDLTKIKKNFLNILQLISFLTIPLAGIILVLGSDFVEIFLGDKWLPMVQAMKILALYGVIRAIGALAGPIFLSVGHPHIVVKLQLSILGLLVLIIYPFTKKWGIVGTSWAIVLPNILVNILTAREVAKVTNCSYVNMMRLLGIPLANTLISCFIVVVFKNFIIFTNIASFIMQVLLFVVIYGFMTFFSDKLFKYGVLSLVKKNIGKL